MLRLFFILLLVSLVSVPSAVFAQSCDPKNPVACKDGTICQDISGTKQYFCTTKGVVPVQVTTPKQPAQTTTTKNNNVGGDTDKTIGGDTDKGVGGDTDKDIGGDLGGSGQGLTNPLNSIDSLPQLLEVVLKAIVQIGTIILTLALVYVGFLFVVAQGNEEKITNAKNALLWTIIGGLVLLGASAIGAVIGSTVGKL